MPLTKLFILVVAGYCSIYLVQQYPATKAIKNEFFHKLFNCSLCLGTWVYFALFAFMKFDLFNELFYFPIVNEMLSAFLISFLAHNFKAGFKLLHNMEFN